jgi:hypothetical protein
MCECENVKKLEIGEPFWGLSGLIMDEDVDGKGSGGIGWVSPLGAG